MSKRRNSKRNTEKTTSQSLATIRVAGNTETVSPVPTGPPSEHIIILLKCKQT